VDRVAPAVAAQSMPRHGKDAANIAVLTGVPAERIGVIVSLRQRPEAPTTMTDDDND
jgi:hypothetical protein